MNSKVSRRVVLCLLVLYILSGLILVLSASVIRREYQDSWILEGLFPQTLLFFLLFLIVAVNVRNNTNLVLLIASFLMLLSAIPSLKYIQIYGVYDSIAHYGYTNRLISSGYVPETGFYAKQYSGTPGMHIFLATITLITGLSTTLAIKLFLAVISSMIPLTVYFVTKDAFSEDARRFILLALCFSSPAFYYLTGTTFALPVYFIFISVFLRQTLVTQLPRRFALVPIIIGTSLIISHGVTSLFLSLLMICILFMLKILESAKKDNSTLIVSRYLCISIFLVVSLMAWWVFHVEYLFSNLLVGMVRSPFSGTTTETFPSAIFELSLSERMALIFVRFYGLFMLLAMGFVGLIVYLTIFRKQYPKKTQTLYLLMFCILGATALIAFPVFFELRTYTFERFVTYSALLSPFFIGLSLYSLGRYLRVHIKKILVRNLFFALLLFVLLAPRLLCVFVFQPLLPQNSENEYIVDYRSVNTIYQKEMIRFAEGHYVNGSKIATDIVTSWQIFGLADTSFASGYSWHNPLYEDDLESEMILLHYAGRSGPLNEKVEYRSRAKLNEFKFKLGNNIVYDNCESFIIVPINS